MLKAKYFIIAILSIVLIDACNKKAVEDINPDVQIKISYRGLYVDGFNTFLGDSIAENKLLSWAFTNNFSHLSLYGLWDITNKPQKFDALASFNKKAKVRFGVKSISAVHSTSNGFNNSSYFNNLRTQESEKFNAFTLENEWWQSKPECDFECTKTTINYINLSVKTNNPNYINEAYIGWLDSSGNINAEAEYLVKSLDRILVHCYVSKPNFSYCKDRLKALETACLKLNVKPEIVILFSAEKQFMFDYFSIKQSNKNFDEAYYDFMNQLIIEDAPLYKNLNFKGYKVFAYTDALASRPN